MQPSKTKWVIFQLWVKIKSKINMGISVIENQWVIILYWKQDNKNKEEPLVGKDEIKDVISIKYELLLTL